MRAFCLSYTFLVLLLAPAGNAEPVHQLFRTLELVPVHLNESPEESTLIVPRVRIPRYALVGGKYVVLPMVGFCAGIQLQGVVVNWNAVAELTFGCSVILGLEGMAFNAFSNNPVLALSPREELFEKLKADRNFFPKMYEISGLNFSEMQLVTHSAKGRAILLPHSSAKARIERFHFSGEWREQKNGQLVFHIGDVHGRTTDGEVISVLEASCGGIVSRFMSAIW